MVRTKIEDFIYSVIDRNTKQVIGSFSNTEELKSQKAKTAAVAAAGRAPSSRRPRRPGDWPGSTSSRRCGGCSPGRRRADSTN